MPYVNVKVTKGPSLTREKKAALVEGITSLLVDLLQKKPEQTVVVIDEIDEENWGFAGMLMVDFRKKEGR